MASSPFLESSENCDPRSHPDFEKIFVRYLDELNLNGLVDPDQILQDHPELGPAILEDLETYVQLRPEDEVHQSLGTIGDYTLRRRIGRGGMGVIYEAWQNSMDRRVALKVLPAGIAADDKAFNRFMREARAAGKLNHPNIVAVHAMGQEENTPFYAMEFIEGETLAQILAKLKDAASEAKTPFGFPRDDVAYGSALARVFAEVAEGLQHAHSKGVIHRDLKPSNLILDREGRLRILDFGLALIEGQESLTGSGDFVGTPLYMSPEQARRKKIRVDHRTDVYSLGATLYEALTLRPPFQGKDHADTLSQIIERDPTELKKINPRIPRDLETIVLKCLRKVPADRYGTAEALGQDLRRFVRGDPIEARPQGRWERLLRRLARQKLRLLMGAGAVGLLLACGLLAWRLAVETGKLRSREYERTVVAAAMKLLRGDTVFAGIQGSPAEVGSFLFAEHRQALDESGRAAVEEALSDLDRALESLPERFEARYHRGRALLLLGRGSDPGT